MTVWDTPQGAIQRALELMRRERVRQQNNMAQRQAFAARTLAPLQPGANAELAALTSKYRAPGGFLYQMPPDVQARVNALQTGRGFSPSDIGTPADQGTLGPRGFLSQLTSPVVSPEANPLSQVPGIGESLGRMTSPLTSPVGAGFAAAFPAATAGGVIVGTLAGTAGGALESAGVPTIPTPLGGIGPRGIGELAGGIYGAELGPPVAGLARLRLSQAAEQAGGYGALLGAERGGSQFGPGPYSRALRTLDQRAAGRDIATTADQAPIEAAVQQHMANTGKTAGQLLDEFAQTRAVPPELGQAAGGGPSMATAGAARFRKSYQIGTQVDITGGAAKGQTGTIAAGAMGGFTVDTPTGRFFAKASQVRIAPTETTASTGPTAWGQLTQAIKEAGKVRPEQRAMFAAERARRTAIGARTLEAGLARGEGTQAFQAAKGAMAGEFARPQFAVPQISDDAVLQITRDIGNADAPLYDRIHAQEALQALSRARIPEPAQLLALKRMNPEADALVRAIQSKRSLGTKAWAEAVSFLGLPQKLKASLDLGTRFRQAMVLGYSHPSQWKSNWAPTANSFFSEDAAQSVMRSLEKNPWYSVTSGEKAGLGFTDQGGHIFGWDPTIPGPERVEGFQGMNDSWINRATDNIPGIRGSQRSFAVDLNKSGVEVYAQEAQAMWDAGVRDPDQYKALASVINHARGYGAFNPGQLAQGVSAFFSGRNLVARFQVALDPFTQPGSLFSPSARQLAAKNVVGMVLGDMSTLGLIGTSLAATGTGSLQLDPTKKGADWLKLRIGNTRVDPWGGFLPLARLIARMGAAGATETGAKDTGVTMDDVKKELGSFFANKEAPLVRVFTNIAGITQPFGKQKILSTQTLVDLYAPFVLQDIGDAVKEHGPLGAAFGIPSAVGVGVSTYQPNFNPKYPPEFSQLPQDQQTALDDFLRRVSDFRAEQKNKGIDTRGIPVEQSIVNLGTQEQRGGDFIGWAIRLHKSVEASTTAPTAPTVPTRTTPRPTGIQGTIGGSSGIRGGGTQQRQGNKSNIRGTIGGR